MSAELVLSNLQLGLKFAHFDHFRQFSRLTSICFNIGHTHICYPLTTLKYLPGLPILS